MHKPEHSHLDLIHHFTQEKSTNSETIMDKQRRPSMLLGFLVVTLGVVLVDSAHLNKLCHHTEDSKFPSMITAIVNIAGQSQEVVPDVRKRSVSPWDYIYDDEPNRFPSRIRIAKCRHQGCVDADGNVMDSGNSVEIKQEILVLYREMKNCKPTFTLQKKMVTVGCTCVRPIVHRLMS
uniref:Uncharacterized protein n=1 Tax=Leptobrachium leishanense TaxID=445787 RepID=A0A8C5PD88_9ANUR